MSTYAENIFCYKFQDVAIQTLDDDPRGCWDISYPYAARSKQISFKLYKDQAIFQSYRILNIDFNCSFDG